MSQSPTHRTELPSSSRWRSARRVTFRAAKGTLVRLGLDGVALRILSYAVATLAWVRGFPFRSQTRPFVEGSLDGVIASNQYGTYLIPRSGIHRPAALAVLRSKVYEPETIELLASVDRSRDIVHAGTFYGDFLPALSHSREEGALIWAFEPNPESYRCTEITILLNGLTNVRLAHGALDAHSGSALLATKSDDGRALGGESYLVEEGDLPPEDRTEKVPLVSIDQVIPDDRKVGVIQLDVEGHEGQALEGAVGVIQRCRPLVVVETPSRADWPVKHYLETLGYQVDEEASRRILPRNAAFSHMG